MERLEEGAEIAITKAKVIDQELGFGTRLDELQEIKLPQVSSRQKV